jgi:hypothetical protein
MTKRNTTQEMYALIAKVASACQSQEQFCKTYGLNLPAFSYWRQKYKETQTLPDAGFEEVLPQAKIIYH